MSKETDPDAVVAQLLRRHLGLEDADNQLDDTPLVYDYADLYTLNLRSLRAKAHLLRAAEATGCSGVIMDVLLFLYHTMAPAVFHQELSRTHVAMDHWIAYQSELCIVNNDRISLDALRGTLDLFLATRRYEDLASLLLSLVLRERSIEQSLSVAVEVAAILEHYRHRIPPWVMESLAEYMQLSELQLTTEKQDADAAPPAVFKSGYLDKRSRKVNTLQANWRMRYFQLDATELIYTKHDAERLQKHHKNPFMDKRQKGNVRLVRNLPVSKFDYSGKFSKRPYCLQIGDGPEGLVLDAATPETQRQWQEALQANIKRLSMDPVWTTYPRQNVLGMPMRRFLLYCFLYHRKEDKRAQIKDERLSAKPSALRQTFQIDDKRYLYSLLLTLARVGEWAAMEEIVKLGQSSGSNILGFNSSSHGLDPADSIGYGPVLDIAEQSKAPASLLATLEALHSRYDAKNDGGWSCRRDVGQDTMAADLRIDVPDAVRATFLS